MEIPTPDPQEIRVKEIENATKIPGAGVKFLDFEDSNITPGDVLRKAL